MGCDNKSIHKGAALWLSSYFMKTSVASRLTEHLSLMSKSYHYSVRGKVLTTNYQVVKHLFEAYAPDDIIPKTDKGTDFYVKLSTLSSFEIASELWIMSLPVHKFMTSMSWRASSLKAYCSRIGSVYEHTEKATRLLLLRRWRITPPRKSASSSMCRGTASRAQEQLAQVEYLASQSLRRNA